MSWALSSRRHRMSDGTWTALPSEEASPDSANSYRSALIGGKAFLQRQILSTGRQHRGETVACIAPFTDGDTVLRPYKQM